MAFRLWNTLGGGPIFFAGRARDIVRCRNVCALDCNGGAYELLSADDSPTTTTVVEAEGSPFPGPFVIFERSI